MHKLVPLWWLSFFVPSVISLASRLTDLCPFTCAESGTNTFQGAREGLSLMDADNSSTAQLPLYTSVYPSHLRSGSSTIKNAFILLSDNMSQTENLFCTMLASAAFEQQKSSSVLIAVQFLYEGQEVSSTCAKPQNSSSWLTWPSTNAWTEGSDSISTSNDFNTSSYAALDAVLSMLKDQVLFPNLGSITVTGFGNGANALQRYASISSQTSEASNVDNGILRFVLVDPSSFMYDNPNRVPSSSYLSTIPSRNMVVGGCAYDDLQPLTSEADSVNNDYSCNCLFSRQDPFPSLEDCPLYDNWPYGTNIDIPGCSLNYPVSKTDYGFYNRHSPLTVLFVLSTSSVCFCPSTSTDGLPNITSTNTDTNICINNENICEDGDLDVLCPAMAQGINRLQRSLNFLSFGQQVFAKTYTFGYWFTKSYRWMAILQSMDQMRPCWNLRYYFLFVFRLLLL